MTPHKSSFGRAVELGYTTPVMSGRLAERETAMHYEANEQPHSQIWLELDESEQIDAVMDYHRRTRVKLENPELHAIAHVVVENHHLSSLYLQLRTGIMGSNASLRARSGSRIRIIRRDIRLCEQIQIALNSIW
jgi:hypothetical protein